MNNPPLDGRRVNLLFIATLAGFLLFAWLTEMEDLGLSSARLPERWSLWRYMVAPAWLTVAYSLYMFGRQAWKTSLVSSLVTAGILSMILASTWIGMSSGHAVLGSALAYMLIASLFTMMIRRPVVAAILSAVLVIVQIVADIVILGHAGQFRIH